MTIREYITSKFQTFGINVSEADLIDMLNDTDFNSENDASGDALNVANIGIAKFIPSLLLRATSISESGFSMTWNLDGIKEYYSILCKRYGLDNELSDRPTVIFS
jgi:hypothetical protein